MTVLRGGNLAERRHVELSREPYRAVQKTPSPVNLYPRLANEWQKRLIAEGRWRQEDFVQAGLGDGTQRLPESVTGACGSTLRRLGHSTYTPILGEQGARQFFSERITRKGGVKVGPSNVFLVGGSRGAVDDFFHVAANAMAPEDVFFTQTPTWATYKENAWRVGRTLLTADLEQDPRSAYKPMTAESLASALERHPEIGCVVIVDPHNPTGFILSEAEAIRMARVLANWHGFVLQDSTYADVTYGQQHVSLLSAAEHLSGAERKSLLGRLGIIHGTQKLSLSGERIALVVIADAALAGAYEAQMTAGRGAASRAAQETAVALYSDEEAIAGMVAELQKRRVELSLVRMRTNELFRARFISALGNGQAVVPDVMAASTVCDVHADPKVPGGGFYSVERFGRFVADVIPPALRGPGGGLKEDSLMRFLLEEAAIVTQPSSAMLSGNGLELRVSFGAADAESLRRIPGRIVDALMRNIRPEEFVKSVARQYGYA
ncbi:MAG: pyridoxal phosphate-dependent aminotransferase [Candidatus Micrarchaeota archaeon]